MNKMFFRCSEELKKKIQKINMKKEAFL
jgi:hypothetical protein